MHINSYLWIPNPCNRREPTSNDKGMIIHAVAAHTACAFAMCFTSKDGRLSTLTWAVWTPQSVPQNHLSASLSSALYSLTDFGLISCPGKVTFVVITRSWRYPLQGCVCEITLGISNSYTEPRVVLLFVCF